MKKQTYQKPAMQVVMLQHQQHLLSGSGKGYEVIGTDQPNLPAGARQYNGGIDWDDDFIIDDTPVDDDFWGR